ncbi:MAG: DNA-processing protein DprA, partial [Desulfonatronovibrionaceae bacterium]
DLIYPARNRDLWARLVKDGLVLTEFPPGTEPEGCNFPHRNRIIAGMCKGVLVVQAEIKSGSLITATLALDQGREVFAVPGGVDMPGYQGCNQLIRDGAWLVRDAGDILEVLGMDMPPGSHGSLPGKSMPEPNPDLTEEEIAVMDLLSRDKALHIDSITRETGWDSAMVSRVLTEMEIKGLIRRAPGMYFSRSV